MRDFRTKRVVVTGASRGIGYAIADAFLGAGADTIILAETAEVDAAAKALSAKHARPVAALRCDVTESETLARTLPSIGTVDVLVNNAGLELETRLDDPDDLAVEERFARIMAINVTGMFTVTRLLLPRLNTGAAIVNTASIWGKFAPAGFSAYAASKHAVIGLTRAWARELGPRGIRVNAVCPGWVGTEAALRSLEAMADARGVASGTVRAEIEAAQDIPGLMEPEAVAGLYLYLASNLAANITGQSINIDRGEYQG